MAAAAARPAARRPPLLLWAAACLAARLEVCAADSSCSVSQLPRANRKLHRVHRDLGNFNPILLHGAACPSGANVCLNPEVLDVFKGPDLREGRYADDPNHWGNYVDSIRVWLLFLIILAVTLLATELGFLLSCCCCFCCGRCRVPDQPQLSGDPAQKRRMAFRVVFLGLFVALSVFFIVRAQVSGNKGITGGMDVMIADPPKELVSLVHRLNEPVGSALQSTSGTVSGMVVRVQSTLTRHVNTEVLTKGFQCAATLLPAGNATVRDLDEIVRQFAEIVSLLPKKEMEESIANLTRDARQLKDVLKDVSATLGQLEVDLAKIKKTLGELTSTTERVFTTAGQFEKELDDVIAGLDQYQSAYVSKGEADALKQSLDAYAANPTPALREEARKKVLAIQDKVSKAPVLAELGREFEEFAAAAADTTRELRELVRLLEEADSSFRGLPPSPIKSLEQVEALVSAMMGQMKPLAGMMRSLGSVVLLIPAPLETAGKVVDRTKSIAADVDCIINVTHELIGDLRPLLGDLLDASAVEDAIGSLDTSIATGLADVGRIEKLIGDTDKQLATLPNFTAYADQIEGMAVDQVAGLDFSSIREKFQALDDTRASTNLQPVIQQIQDLIAKLEDPQTGPAKAKELGAQLKDPQLQKDMDATGPAMQNLLQLIDVVLATCTPPPPKANCDQNRAYLKGAGEKFSRDAGRMPDLSSLGEAFRAQKAAADLTSTRSQLDQLSSVDAKLAQMPDLGKYRSDIDELIAKQLDPLLDAVGSPDISFLFKVEQQFDLEMLEKVSKALSDGLAQFPMERFEQAQLQKQRYVAIVEGPPSSPGTLASVSRAFEAQAVEQRLRSQGLLGALQRLVDSTADVAKHWNGTSDDLAWQVSAHKQLAQAAPTAAAFEDRAYSEYGITRQPSYHGDIWLLLNLLSLRPLPKEAYQEFRRPLVHGYVDDSGVVKPYPAQLHADYCMTDSCLHNTVDYLNRDRASFGEFKMPMSREAMFLLGLLPPMLVLVLATGTMATGWKRSGLALSICSLLWLPVFLLVLALVVPVTMVIGDVCASAGSVIASSADAIFPQMCHPYAEETGLCFVNLAALNTSISFLPANLLRQVMAGQQGNEMQGIWDQLERAVRKKAQEQNLTEIINGNLDGANLTEAMQQELDLERTQAELAQHASDFVVHLSRVITAQSLRNVYIEFEDSTCCNFLASLRIYFESLLALAICTLVLACPGGLIVAEACRRQDDSVRVYALRHGSAPMDRLEMEMGMMVAPESFSKGVAYAAPRQGYGSPKF